MALEAHRAAVNERRGGFAGEIMVPGGAGYDEARTIFNARIDRRPGVIAQRDGVNDVVRAVRLGREVGLEIAVRGGGTASPGGPSRRVAS